MNSAPAPAGNGDPGASESEPDLLTAKTETSPDPEFVTKAKLESAVGKTATFLLMPQPFSKNIATKNRQDRMDKRGTRRINREESIAIISQMLKIKDQLPLININDTREDTREQTAEKRVICFEGLFCSFRYVQGRFCPDFMGRLARCNLLCVLSAPAANYSPLEDMKTAFLPFVMYPLKSTDLTLARRK
ncbi:MAG: hypothetical protein WA672_11255 [Candidatus Angelobacter sp.]